VTEEYQTMPKEYQTIDLEPFISYYYLYRARKEKKENMHIQLRIED
jgi:hypothetical protein